MRWPIIFVCFPLICLASQMPGQTQPAAVATAGGSTATQSESTLDHATQLINEGKNQQALIELDALAEKHPGLAGLEYLRGFAHYQRSELKQAEIAFADALAQNSRDKKSRQLLGMTLYLEGKAAAAITVLEKDRSGTGVTDVDPGYLLALCYVDVQRFDDARRSIAGEYGFPPDSPSAYLLTARILVRREYMVPAESAARKSLELDPHLLLAHELLGEIDLARSDIAGAIAELQSERSLDPLRATVYERLGDAYFRAGEDEQARQSLNRALLLDPNSTGPYILLGKVMIRQRNPLAAIGYLQRALRMDPGNYIAHYLLGQSYHAEGLVQEASREFKRSEELRFGPASTPQQTVPPS